MPVLVVLGAVLMGSGIVLIFVPRRSKSPRQAWNEFSAASLGRIGRLLDQVTISAGARYVSFVSVTSYRWSLPLEEARMALLATHIGEEPLAHEHGFPLRLVAPNRRGFEWVKWITRIEVQTAPDEGQVLSIFSSSFTDAGRGQKT